MLGGTATTGRVAALLEVPVVEIRTAMAELVESGLIDAVGRTSPVVTGRVLGEMSEAEYRGLHGRAAELLHHGGFPAVVVAKHLLEAGGARGSWAARVLVAAADDALAGDELDRAGRCLDLAYRAARRADERAAIATRLVSVEWRINPSSRTRNFGRLKAALRTGRVPQTDLPGTVLHMLWHGYGLHADHALARLDRAAGLAARGAGTFTHAVGTTVQAGGVDGSAPGTNSVARGTNAAARGVNGAVPGADSPAPGSVGALPDSGGAVSGSGVAVPGSSGAVPGSGGAVPGSGARREVGGPVRAADTVAGLPGLPGRAAGTVARVAGSSAHADDPFGYAARLEFLVSWLRYTHPGHVQRHPCLVAAVDTASGDAVAQQESPHGQAALLLAALCSPVEGGGVAVSGQDVAGPSVTEMVGAQRVSGGLNASGGVGGDLDEIAAGAQRLLARQRLTLTTVEPLVAAVDCLMYCDRLDTADAWCASLLAEATARNAPAWQSIFAAARAEALLRKGDLVGAAEHAVLALNVLPAEQLGVWVGRPIAVLVLALTGQGKHAEAAAQLERPVPRAMFESRFALLYLTAHGRHYLATGRVEEALGHFRRCGRLMQEWGLDFAWLVPWRNELAAASLWAGRHWQAQTFATRHLDLIGRAEHHQTGAVSLRLLAATSEPHRRVPLLRRAITIARAGVDQIELALVLADLGTAYRAIGDMDRARPLLREATRLANACDSAAVRNRLPANGTQRRMAGAHLAATDGQGSATGARPAVSGGEAAVTGGWPIAPGGPAGAIGGRPGPSGGRPGATGGPAGATGGHPGATGGHPGATGGHPGATGGHPGATGGRSGVSGVHAGAPAGRPGGSGGPAEGGWHGGPGARPGSADNPAGVNPGTGSGSPAGDLAAVAPVAPTGPLSLRLPAPVSDPLSPAERRVAELAALGNRNRDIAEALDITTSTVEQHLTRVYRKLAVSRRSELRFALLARSEGTTHTAVG